MRLFIKYARAVWGEPQGDPTAAWPKLREVPRRERRALSKAEVAAMLGLAPEWLAWFIRVAASTGLREGTVRQLHPGLVHDGVLEVPAAMMKARRPLKLPVPEGVAALLNQPVTLPDTAAVWRAFRKCAKAAGVRGEVSPHDLRRTFRARLVEAGVDMDTIKALGAWSSSEVMFAHYSVNNPAVQRAALKEALV